MKYSINKGIEKGFGFVTTFLAAIVIVLGLSDVSIWDTIVKYVYPVVGTLTFGGLITILTNYVKFKYKEIN